MTTTTKLPELSEGYYYSASQIATFRDCKRKWAFDKIDRIPRPTNRYAEDGLRIHAKLETYLETGHLADPDEDEDTLIILPGIQYLPEPGVAQTEERFVYPLPGLGGLVGYIDFQYVGRDGIPVVGDHKTTSDVRWAKKPEDLDTDEQSVIYARIAMERYNTDRTHNAWIYYQRDPRRPKAVCVQREMTMANIVTPWELMLEDVHEMKRLRDSGVKAAEVGYNPEVCDKYGGCPYVGQCKRPFFERLKGHQMDIRARLAARKAAKEQQSTQAEAAPEGLTPPLTASGAADAVNPPPAQAAAEPRSILDEMRKRKAAAATPKPAPKAAAPKPAPKAAAPKPAPKAAAPVESSEELIGQLYVGCLPTKGAGAWQPFADIVAEATAAIQQEHGTHYRLIEGLYGGNAAVLQMAVRQVLETRRPESVFVDLASQEARDALQTLEECSAVVVRGM